MQTFACIPTRARISVEQCVRLYELGRLTKKTQTEQLRTSQCVGCVVGEAHRKGEAPSSWPDGAPVTRHELTPASSGPPPVPTGRRRSIPLPPPREARRPAPAPRPAHEETSMAKRGEARTITHAGETRTIAEWAAKTLLTDAAIRMRLRKGWTESDAVSVPSGQRPAKPAPPASAPASKPRARRPPPVAGRKRARRARAAPKAPVIAREEVVAMVRDLDPAALLSRLGYAVEDLGEQPAGRVLVVRLGGAAEGRA